MLIQRSTEKTIEEASKALEAAIQDNHFGLMQVHDLQASMKKKGVELENPCLIFEVCQPHEAKEVLEQNMSLSTALPCRISLYQENGKTVLATLKPTVLLGMFHSPDLQSVAEEVEAALLKIMEAAAS